MSKTNLFCLLLAASVLSGCAYLEHHRVSLEQWWQDETGTHHREHTAQENARHKYHSSNPADYIFANGKGLAIPGKKDYDLYISPFEPTKYFRSKEEPGTEIVCPYSGRLLILGDRKNVSEKEIP